MLPWLFAAGAVFWLMWLAYFAAFLAAPAGRERVHDQIVKGGITTDVDTILLIYGVSVLAVPLVAAIVHGAAYYGLRSFRAWGWVVAVVVSVGWSFALVGIPILMFLLRRPVRQAYGIS